MHADGTAKFDVCEGFWFVGFFGMKNQQDLASGSVIDSYKAFAIIQPLQKAITRPIQCTMLQDGTFPVPHREGFATRGERNLVTLGMHSIGIKVLFSGHE